MAIAVPNEILEYEGEKDWSYIVAGFRSHCNKNQAYLFAASKYMIIDYVEDKILGDIGYLCSDFSCLDDNNPIGENGCDCAFGSHEKNKAYLFQYNECVLFDYVAGEMIGEYMEISEMFPFLNGTDFEEDLGGAFESSIPYQAYIFKHDKYVVINYKDLAFVQGPKKIADGFHCLRNTIFENGIDAAFTSHTTDFAGQGCIEAYLFRRDHCAMIRFSPDGSTDCRIVDGPKSIRERWPTLDAILPVKILG